MKNSTNHPKIEKLREVCSCNFTSFLAWTFFKIPGPALWQL